MQWCRGADAKQNLTLLDNLTNFAVASQHYAFDWSRDGISIKLLHLHGNQALNLAQIAGYALECLRAGDAAADQLGHARELALSKVLTCSQFVELSARLLIVETSEHIAFRNGLTLTIAQ